MNYNEEYKKYCEEEGLTPLVSFTTNNSCKIKYGDRNPSEVTAWALFRMIPTGFRRKVDMQEVPKKIDFAFKTDGYCYLNF